MAICFYYDHEPRKDLPQAESHPLSTWRLGSWQRAVDDTHEMKRMNNKWEVRRIRTLISFRAPASVSYTESGQEPLLMRAPLSRHYSGDNER